MITTSIRNASPPPEHLVLEQLATVARALAQPHRLLLLTILAQGQRSVETLAEAAGLKLGNTSQHLHRLRRAGLVTSRKDAQRVVYQLSDEAALVVLAILRHIADGTLAKMRVIAQKPSPERDPPEPVSREELPRRIRKN